MSKWIVIAVWLLAVAPLRAEPLLDLPAPGARDEAKVKAALGRFGEAYKAKRLPEASAAAQEAYAAGGGAEALEAVAVTALNQGKAPRAFRLYGAIAGDSAASADVQSRARRQREALDRQAGRLAISGGRPGDRLAIDGDFAGTLPLPEEPRVMPGRHTVVVSSPGRRPFEAALRFTAGKPTSLAIPEPQGPAPVNPALAAARARTERARAALPRVDQARLRALLAEDPMLERSYASLVADPDLLQAVREGKPGLGQDERVRYVVERIRTLVLKEAAAPQEAAP